MRPRGGGSSAASRWRASGPSAPRRSCFSLSGRLRSADPPRPAAVSCSPARTAMLYSAGYSVAKGHDSGWGVMAFELVGVPGLEPGTSSLSGKLWPWLRCPSCGAVGRELVIRNPREESAVEDDWGQDCTRRAKAALVDTTVANPARVGDYLCGGRDNFEADRRAVRIMRQASSAAAAITPAARAFRQRAVRYLAAEAGIRQFLQIGTGMATSGDTHEVAQSIDPDCRIIYADSDPAVLAHGRALMRSSRAGAVGYVDADVREIGEIVAGARPTLDFGRPVAVLL